MTENKLSSQMDNTNVSKPEDKLVSQYENNQDQSWCKRFIESVDTWHRWIDLLLKVGVSAVIIVLLWRWIDFVMEAIGTLEYQRPTVSVQIALVSGTSVNLIGLLAIMAKYLFPEKK